MIAASDDPISLRRRRCGTSCGMRRSFHHAAVLEPEFDLANRIEDVVVLRNESVGAELFGEARELVTRTAGEENDRYVGAEHTMGAAFEQRFAGQCGQTKIEKDEIGIDSAHREWNRDQRLMNVQINPFDVEELAQSIGDQLIVIDEENFRTRAHCDARFAERSTVESDTSSTGFTR